MLPGVQREPPVLQFVPIASLPDAGNHWKKKWLHFLCTFSHSPPAEVAFAVLVVELFLETHNMLQ